MDRIDSPPDIVHIGVELRQIIGDVIGADLSDVEDDASLLEYVSSSLELVEAIRRVYDRFGVFVSLRDVLEGQANLAAIAMYLDQALKAQQQEEASDSGRRSDGGHRKVPLAPPQRHIAFLTRYSSGASAAYNEPLVVRLEGPLYIPALQGAVEAVGERYEALNTALGRDEEALEIGIGGRLELAVTACAAEQVDTRLEEVAGRAFAVGERLFRAELLRMSETGHLLILVGHALLLDSRGLAAVLEEIAELYRKLLKGGESALRPPAMQWTDYMAGRAKERASAAAVAAEQYWTAVLAGDLPRLELPSDRPRPATKSYEGARLQIPVDAGVATQMERWAEAHGTTPFAVFFSAFSATVHRLSGQKEIVIGAGSGLLDEVEAPRVAARTSDMAPVRSRYDPARSFADHLRQQSDLLAEALKHSRSSLAELIQAVKLPRDQSRSPLFTVAMRRLAYAAPPSFDSLDASFHIGPGVGARYDIELTLMSFSGSVSRICCDYSTELFDEQTISRWFRGMLELLKEGMEREAEQCSLLPIMSGEERHTLLYEWNATEKRYPHDRTTLDLILDQAGARPDRPAVRGHGEELTYAQLAARVDQFAQQLWAREVRPGQRVGILLPRSPDLVASMLAAWRVGAMYVPLDRSFPKKRLAFMLADAAVETVITNRQLARTVEEESSAHPFCIDAPDAKSVTGAALPSASATQSAYLIYTSGSTGQPKGVEIGHRELINFLLGSRERLAFTTSDSLLAITTISFDIANLELYLPLIAGGVVELAEDGLAADGFRLADRLEMRKPSFVQATASTWKAVLAAGWSGDSNLCILSAGEALSRELGEQLLPKGRAVWNLYGPTETTVFSTAYRVASEPGKPMRVGRPYQNTQLYILDEWSQPVPIGVVGELYIGGDGVARGYWRRPELTDERFLPNPFRSGERLYRTGDLARYLENGDVVCLGRVDDQVKIHGVRVELGEVEAALRGMAGIRDAVVTSWTDIHGDTQLVAHVLSEGDSNAKPAEIRARLRERLPETMIPPYILFTNAFPMTANGKIHRASLPLPHAVESAARTGSAVPETPTERQLAGAWSRVLGIGVESIGRDDDFMDLGGHSLLMTQLMVEVRKLFNVSFGMREFFAASTLRKFAALVDELRRTRVPALNDSHRFLPVRGAEWSKQRMAFLRSEAQLPASITPARGLTYQQPAAFKTALLTGATGFLGAYIAAEILRFTKAHLHCLVRPKQGTPGKSRIEAQMRHYELWREDEAWQSAWNERVHIVDGDVILPRLGMSDGAYESLARDVDCIIHSAAHVNFIYPYEALKASNVLGVHEIIRFAFHGRIKPVHYLSTAAVWPMGCEYTFYEQDSLDHGKLLNLGYDEAKWVGEKCLLHAGERGLPVARYRPGEVGGDSQTGKCVLSHFVVAGLKGFLQYGAFPTVDTFFDVTPVDYVAKAIVHMVFRGNPLGRAFHLTNPQRCHINDAFAFLRSLGYRFEELPWEQLRGRLIYDSEFSSNALFPYQAVLEAMDERSLQLPNYDCRDTLRELDGSSVVCAPVDHRLLGKYMDYLRAVDFMPAPRDSAIRVSTHAS